MARQRVVVIEDDEDMSVFLEAALTEGGFRVDRAFSARQGLKLVEDIAPDCVLLDLGLPGADGLDVCRAIREEPLLRQTSILIVTARDDDNTVVEALDCGADDYVLKPITSSVLLARVRAVLRRRVDGERATPDAQAECDGLQVDLGSYAVTLDEDELEMSPTQVRLLHCLMTHPGRAFTREQLCARVIEGGAMVSERNIDVHVRRIRRVLGEYAERIQTVRGVGYRFGDEA